MAAWSEERGVEERWTRSGVRLRRLGSGGDDGWDWLLVPGGPGLGAESLVGLAAVVELPGRVWLVDLPGDGSNRDVAGVAAVAAGASSDPYTSWPGCLAEAADEVDYPVLVGHSTGGMFALSVPELADRLAGLVLVSSAPHAGWRAGFARWAEAHPIPGLDAAADAYARSPGDTTLRELTLAAAPWSFTPRALADGRELLASLPYCHDAVAWAEAYFDDTYRSRWAPQTLPTLIVSGELDHVVDQGLWEQESSFGRPSILRRTIPDAGHFPWFESPAAVRAAFREFVGVLGVRGALRPSRGAG